MSKAEMEIGRETYIDQIYIRDNRKEDDLYRQFWYCCSNRNE